MSSHLNNHNRMSNERSEKAMKAPIKHDQNEYVWQEEGTNENMDNDKEYVGWDANGSPVYEKSKDDVKGRIEDSSPSRPQKSWKDAFLHDWSENILHLTCKYCDESPCECDMTDISM